jgi:excisionase family DNA binding protein
MKELGDAVERIIREEVRDLLKSLIHLDPNQVAELLSVSKTTVYSAIKSGELKAVRTGDRKGTIVSLDALNNYVGERSNQPEQVEIVRRIRKPEWLS